MPAAGRRGAGKSAYGLAPASGAIPPGVKPFAALASPPGSYHPDWCGDRLPGKRAPPAIVCGTNLHRAEAALNSLRQPSMPRSLLSEFNPVFIQG